MVVAANTMAMTARERMSEYATFKALGFDGFRIGVLVWGESLTLTAAGGALGMALTFPAARYFESQLGQFFPVFQVSNATLLMDAAAIVIVGIAASVVPTWRAARVNVVEGFRHLG
jgi:putative ABC transport system permease protein